MAGIASQAARMSGAEARIYRYVVRYDTGSAPNPFGGWCSLAICKPRIRNSARVGDWVIGLRSRASDRVIYVMQVEDVLTFPAFWTDKRFAKKKPDQCRSSDNIYRPGGAGALVQVPNGVHDAGSIARDLSSPNVLVSQRFWYFGANSPELSTDLVHLVHSGVGHTYKDCRDNDAELFEQWLGVWPTGIHGEPVDGAKLGVSLGVLTQARSGAPRLNRCSPAGEPVVARSRQSRC